LAFVRQLAHCRQNRTPNPSFFMHIPLGSPTPPFLS
jgi:hypothetical protein